VRRLLQRIALAASLVLVVSVTLRPTSEPNRVELAPWATQQLSPVNIVGNIALFALPSALLWSLGWPFRRTVLSGFFISLAIELLQLAVPGRTTATVDVLCNTFGAAAGWLLARKYLGRGGN
jgi:glycopeptide antibiotics resistance protein